MTCCNIAFCMHDFCARASAPWKLFCCLLKFLVTKFYKCRVGSKKSESRGLVACWLIEPRSLLGGACTSPHAWDFRLMEQNRLFVPCDFAFRIVWKSCSENIRAVHELSNFCKDPAFAVIVKIHLWYTAGCTQPLDL